MTMVLEIAERIKSRAVRPRKVCASIWLDPEVLHILKDDAAKIGCSMSVYANERLIQSFTYESHANPTVTCQSTVPCENIALMTRDPNIQEEE